MGAFTAACADFYRKTRRLKKLNDKMFFMSDKEIPYTGQTKAFELDAIIESHIHSIVAFNEAADGEAIWNAAKWNVIEMLHDFGILPNTRVTVTIPHELEFEIWVDEENTVHIEKTMELAPEVDDNIIILSGKLNGILDDDDDEEGGKKILIYATRTKENEEYFAKTSKENAGDNE